MKVRKIVCIVGESGTGKTMLAEYINKKLKTNIVLSYTDRPKRTEDEKGHKFITKKAFNKFKYVDMVARTLFGGHRYCTLHTDVRRKNLYVIDEAGLDYLSDTFPDIYELYTVRVHRDIDKRITSGVSKERLERDNGNFNKEDSFYDKVLFNNGTISEFEDSIEEFINSSKRVKSFLIQKG